MTAAGIETAHQHAEPKDLQRSRFSPDTSRRQASALVGEVANPDQRGPEHRCPGRLVPTGRYSRGLTRVSLASLVLASSSPSCEIRQLLVHVYPGGSKAPGAERLTVFYGRRGRPVKKPRFIPAELAHQWARKLQARRLGTVSVL